MRWSSTPRRRQASPELARARNGPGAVDFPHLLPASKTFRIGGMTKTQLLVELQRHGIQLNASARLLFDHRGFTTAPPVSSIAVAPLASDRYLLKLTLSAHARATLDRARDLLRHAVPSGDPAVIVERALTVLVQQLETSRCAAARRPRAEPKAPAAGRHVPAAVRREVWQRDAGRCAFLGADGRCRETGWLELHHVVPFARGGPSTVENLELRCRAHNAYKAEQEFGTWIDRARLRADGPRDTSSVRTELDGPRLGAGSRA